MVTNEQLYSALTNLTTQVQALNKRIDDDLIARIEETHGIACDLRTWRMKVEQREADAKLMDKFRQTHDVTKDAVVLPADQAPDDVPTQTRLPLVPNGNGDE
jgi:hypothetical protein